MRFLRAEIGFNRYNVLHFGSDYGVPKNNDLGIPNGNIAGRLYTYGIARFDIPGIHPTGSLGSTNAVRIANAFQYTDNFTWVRGRHAMKFGADIRRCQSTLTNPQTQPRGWFDFDRNITSNRGAAGTGHPWASFLVGYPWQVRRDFVDTRPGVRMTYWGFYAQDDIRVSPAQNRLARGRDLSDAAHSGGVRRSLDQCWVLVGPEGDRKQPVAEQVELVLA